MMTVNRTELVRRKIKRAKHHIEEFNGRIDQFFYLETGQRTEYR
jgi:hypothetical protein